ncbi:KH domain-containing protein [Corallococcus praedator]|uniref:RNA-binding protein KhpA n=1 Tax=Corallococcus praedator TaxID=2316724 RepID=A0ABX9QQ28_9BACT|nr:MULTISPECIES: KH domain-containing protein [Corallococcus]RKH21866.1 KH domain-containing protein [Corallococcus sp. CA047B]RKH36461.1 KH domain-containing protein [Corallococcus sp. CA031C]RKI16296.1 KH domain-containing protein [Corallococcus praedator]
MEPLLTYLAKALVDQPDQVALRISEADGGRLYELKVAPEDVGKVIGRDGRTVNALRTLLTAAAQKQGQKVRLEILDDRRAPGAPVVPPAPDDAR